MTSVRTKRVCSQGERSPLPTHRLGVGPVSTLPAWLVEIDKLPHCSGPGPIRTAFRSPILSLWCK